MTYNPVIEAGNWVFSVMAMVAVMTFIGFSCLGVYFWWTGQKWH